MLTLQNGELRVDVLDPVADATRLGPRFCWGGYIWQVHDRNSGPLLTGPEWPAADPSVFNGQGLPESFRHRTLDGHPLTWRATNGVALGAGELRCNSENEVHVTSPCSWEIAQHVDRMEFTTRQTAAGYSYALSRRIELADRDVRSNTRLTNLSPHDALTLEWFAHPFFALVDGSMRAELPMGACLPENPGFSLDDRVLTQKRRFTRQDDGYMERRLRLPPHQPLVAQIAHPTLKHVRFQTDFAPDSCVIWGNDRTFSLEPYLTLDLAPGESREWSLRYRFGASSGMATSSASSRAPAA
jgi:hypothetical protein